jgi:hypothetical protein
MNNTGNNNERKSDYSCKPPPGKTYLTIGQDFFAIQEYVMSQYNASLHRQNHNDHHIRKRRSTRSSPSSSTANILPLKYFHPASTMAYTDIYELKGLDQPADYGSGIEYAKGKRHIEKLCVRMCDLTLKNSH